MRTSLALAAVAAASLLTACQTPNGGVGGVTASDEFARVCRVAPVLHAGFVVVAAEANVSSRVVAGEAVAYRVLDRVCRTPPADVAQALALALEAYAEILAARVKAGIDDAEPT
jgi:hypothetical protein